MCLPLDKLQSDGANKTTAAEGRPTGACAMTLTSFICLHRHLSLSLSIPTSSYVPIFYLRGFEEEWEGTGGRAAWHRSAMGPLHSSARPPVLNAAVVRLTILGKHRSACTCFSSLMMKMHGAACLHVNSYRYESYISAHISIFLHLDIDSCKVLTLCNP